jgi:tetratricopeptide (TPR) repeat protein
MLSLAFSLVCAISLMGWIVLSERPPSALLTEEPTSNAETDVNEQFTEAQLDEIRVAALEAEAANKPEDIVSRLELGHLYFGARLFEQAIPWYEEMLSLSPDHVNAGINLGISYYYVGQVENSVAHIERSLHLDPLNQRALLSLGIVTAFGLNDIEGATVLWQKAMDIDPNSLEGQAARDSLDRMSAGHMEVESIQSNGS